MSKTGKVTVSGISDDTLHVNEHIAELFDLISSYYRQSGDVYRARTYSNAANLISAFPDTITSGQQAKENIPGIGQSVAADIDEYLSTGKISRLVNLEEQNAETKKVLDLFTSFYGIGTKTANKFYNEGYRTLEDLWYEAPLTEHQRAGIIYREHLALRIPRDEMDLINERLKEIFDSVDPDLIWMIAGSYRRGEANSGDIDVLIQGKGEVDLARIVEELEKAGFIVETLAQGPIKYLGIVRLDEEHPAHRFDIVLLSEEEWPFAVMYFTGSQRFNILMRQRAKDLGLRLNEHGLYDEEGNEEYATSEEDIFNILGVKYLTPEERTRSLKELPLLESTKAPSGPTKKRTPKRITLRKK
jgi:DNA polymerase/3'-5' exonuclease PolX